MNNYEIWGTYNGTIETLEQDLINYKDGGTPLTFVIG